MLSHSASWFAPMKKKASMPARRAEHGDAP
jgi:hypothetical protein